MMVGRKSTIDEIGVQLTELVGDDYVGTSVFKYGPTHTFGIAWTFDRRYILKNQNRISFRNRNRNTSVLESDNDGPRQSFELDQWAREPIRLAPEPNRFEPEPYRFSPEPRRLSPVRSLLSPKPNNVFSYPDRYATEPKRYSPEPYRYSPDTNRFAPESNRFPPESNRFAPESNRFASELNRFASESNRFASESTRYAQEPNRYSPDLNRFVQKSHQSAPELDRRVSVKPNTIRPVKFTLDALYIREPISRVLTFLDRIPVSSFVFYFYYSLYFIYSRE